MPEEDLLHVLKRVGPLWERLREERIFLTGGTGFFGKWLIESLLYANQVLDLNCRATVLSRNPVGFAELNPHLVNPATVTFLAGDVRNFEYPEGKYGFVIHAATDVVSPANALDVFSSCVDGTRRVSEFASQAGCSDFLLVSSGAVYGRQPDDMAAIPENHSGAPDPLDKGSAYGEGKRCAEWLATEIGREAGFSVKIARCFAFVGPYLPLDKHFAIGNFIRDALSEAPILIQGNGSAVRSYLYAADLVVWLWTILLKAPAGVAYNVGGDEAIDISGLANRVNVLAGSPSEVNVMMQRDPAAKPSRYVPDVRKAEIELGLKPDIGLDEAIRRTIRWNLGVRPQHEF